METMKLLCCEDSKFENSVPYANLNRWMAGLLIQSRALESSPEVLYLNFCLSSRTLQISLFSKFPMLL